MLVGGSCQTDGRNRCQTDKAEGSVDAKFRIVHNLSDHLLQFALQVVLGLHAHLLLYSLDGFGQCPFVHLLVLVQWYALNLHGSSRHHIRRFPFQNKVVESFNIYLLITHDVGSDELAAILVIEGLHGDVLHARELFDDTLHFAHLDAESANLHLTISSSDELQVTIRQPTHNVASMIDAVVVRLLAERIRCECQGILFRTVQVAATYLWTTDPQFALLSVFHQLSLLVHHVESERIERLADRCILLILSDGIYRRKDSTLCGAVSIVQQEIGRYFHRDETLATHRKMAQ